MNTGMGFVLESSQINSGHVDWVSVPDIEPKYMQRSFDCPFSRGQLAYLLRYVHYPVDNAVLGLRHTLSIQCHAELLHFKDIYH